MKITVYTRTVCPKCMLIKSQLENNGLEYEVVNMDENEDVKNKISEIGFMSVPVVKFDDEYEGNFIKIQFKIKALSE